MDFKENNEKLAKITMVEPDEALAARVNSANKSMLKNGLPLQICLTLAFICGGIASKSAAKYVLLACGAIFLLFLIFAILPHKLMVCKETLTISDYRMLGSAKNPTWFASLRVSEINDTVEVAPYIALYPAGSLNTPKEPFERGTEVKLIRFGKAYYFVPIAIFGENEPLS